MSEIEGKKTLLILKSQQQSLLAVESFLRNRGWEVHSTTNLKEALSHTIAKQPQFVLITVDHPNKKVKNLPKILMSALPVCVAAFAENANAASFKEVSDSKTEYKLFPPVTGPAVERMVNKYHKDLITKKSTSHDREKLGISGGDSDNMTIAIKGQLSAQLLVQLMGDDNNLPPSDWAQSAGSDSDPYTGLPTEKKQGGWFPQSDSPGTAQPPLAPSYSEEDIEGLDLREKKQRPSATDRSSDESNTHQRIQEGIIESCTEQALAEICILTAHPEAKRIAETTQIACITVESPRFSGYLIAAMGANQKMNDALLEKIKNRLFFYLKQYGEEVDSSEALRHFNIRPVAFESWALECAHFLRKSIHDQNEIAMAFFPTEETKVRWQDSLRDDMVKVSIEDVICDLVLQFDIYLHLPINDRYILYTPRGGIFYQTQKEKLLQKGISFFHILKEAVPLATGLKIQSFLNESINEWELAKRPS